MFKAIWKDKIIAQAEQCQLVEGNRYFPVAALDMQYSRPSETHTQCFWKGQASYYDIVVDGEVNRDAAWFYPTPSAAAARIAGHVAFWRGVKVIED